ncbi:MAG: hypothetical protein ABJB01_02710 [Rudaea sp.]
MRAIAERDFDGICARVTDRMRTGMLNIRACSDSDVLFGLWCESYPVSARIISVEFFDETAILTVEGEVGDERIHASILLQRLDGTWLVDRERFERTRRPPPKTLVRRIFSLLR